LAPHSAQLIVRCVAPSRCARLTANVRLQGNRLDRTTFTKLLAARLYPLLRAEGFRGSGTTLRRLSPQTVHVFNVQGSTGAVRCYLNLGCHFGFLPVIGGGELSAISESQCAFRARIESPPEQPFGWYYGQSEPEAVANVNRIIEEWPRQARRFFDQHAYPEGLAKLVADALPTQTHPAQLLLLGRIAVHLGQAQRAAEFSNAALARANPAATDLQHDLRTLLEEALAI
jgi:hypothetical protein